MLLVRLRRVHTLHKPFGWPVTEKSNRNTAWRVRNSFRDSLPHSLERMLLLLLRLQMSTGSWARTYWRSSWLSNIGLARIFVHLSVSWCWGRCCGILNSSPLSSDVRVLCCLPFSSVLFLLVALVHGVIECVASGALPPAVHSASMKLRSLLPHHHSPQLFASSRPRWSPSRTILAFDRFVNRFAIPFFKDSRVQSCLLQSTNITVSIYYTE